MQTKKLNLANIKGKLSRTEMKQIMAGSGDESGSCQISNCSGPCTGTTIPSGTCKPNTSMSKCYCTGAY